jgi:hypothetical protein
VATGSAKSGLRYDFNLELSALSAGTHQYWFVFNDGKHSDIRYPKSKNYTFNVGSDYAKAKDSAAAPGQEQPGKTPGQGQAPSQGSEGGAGPRGGEDQSESQTSAATGFAFMNFRPVQNYAYEQPKLAYAPAPQTQSLGIALPWVQHFMDIVAQIRALKPAEAKAVVEAPRTEPAAQAEAQAPTSSGVWKIRKK